MGQISFLSKRLELILNARARLANFIGELCKFKALSDGIVFSCLRKTLDTPHLANMLMVCTIIEVCGKFLQSRKASHKRMLNLIEVMTRLKNTMPYPLYAISIVESTINSLQSCDTGYVKNTVTPTFPSASFIKPLLRSPDFDSEDKTIYGIFRSLNWENELVQMCCIVTFFQEILKIRTIFLKAWKTPFSSIEPFALFVCNISSSHPSFVHSLLNDYCELILTEIEVLFFFSCFEEMRPNTQKLVSTFHVLCVICQIAPTAKGLMSRLVEAVLTIFEFPTTNVFQRGAIASCIYFCLRHFDDLLGGSDINDLVRKRLKDLVSNYYDGFPLPKVRTSIYFAV